MARVRVRREPNIEAVLRLARPSQPIGRYMRQRALLVESGAKRGIALDPRRIDTGNLRNSISIKQRRFRIVTGYRIGTNVKYAEFVHNGTRHMQANPFMERGVSYAFRGR